MPFVSVHLAVLLVALDATPLFTAVATEGDKQPFCRISWPMGQEDGGLRLEGGVDRAVGPRYTTRTSVTNL